MPAFDMVVVGSGGGPDECNLSAYLIKPRETSWEEGIIGLEAGSGQGALARILRDTPDLFTPTPDPSLEGPTDCKPTTYGAANIYSFVHCYLISHAHFDHISSLVISAGSLGGRRKRIYAATPTLRDLETVFSGRLWPKLASWNEADEKYNYQYCKLDPSQGYKIIFPPHDAPTRYPVSVRSMPLSHGCNEEGNYDSYAFFIKHESTGKEFLFFGDVEPDSVAKKPMLGHVWRSCAPKIPSTLSALFIECSYPRGRRDNELFGHMTPEHLVDELCNLAEEVVEARRINIKASQRSTRQPARKKRKRNNMHPDDVRGALTGLRVYVTHCKDAMDASSGTNRDLIVKQIKELVEAKGLGVEVHAVVQGSRIEI